MAESGYDMGMVRLFIDDMINMSRDTGSEPIDKFSHFATAED